MQFFASVSYIKPFFLILVSLCVVMFPCRPLCFFTSLCHALLPFLPLFLRSLVLFLLFTVSTCCHCCCCCFFFHFLLNQVDPFRLTNTVNIHRVCMYITVLPKQVKHRFLKTFKRSVNIPFWRSDTQKTFQIYSFQFGLNQVHLIFRLTLA